MQYNSIIIIIIIIIITIIICEECKLYYKTFSERRKNSAYYIRLIEICYFLEKTAEV
jgi:hypothetical protein